MGDPELHSDEKILLTTKDVFVKAIPFEAVLTSKRIILIDRKKNLIPTKDILLATIRDVQADENAIRDQVINLSLITSSGETRQLVLTFSRTAGGGRKRERDEWVKKLKELTGSSFQKAIRRVIPAFDQEPQKKPREQVTPPAGIASSPSARKEIEGVLPIKKIVETGSVPPKPIEISSLPEGSFCSRCGSRVPPESAFCNRCGSKIIQSGLEPVPEKAIPQVPVEPAVPAAEVPVAAEAPVIERKERQVEKEIQSIEPLIEDSVPRVSEAAPPVPSSRLAEPSQETEQSDIAKAAQSVIDGAVAQAGQTEMAAQSPPEIQGQATATPATGQAAPQRRSRSVFPELFPKKDTSSPPAAPPGGQAPPRRNFALIAAVIIILLVVAGGAFLFWNFMQGAGPAPEPAVTPTATPTPTITLAPATIATTAPPVTTAVPTPVPVLIPPDGVWVRVNYSGSFKGSIGTAADQRPVADSGDQFYSVPTSEGIVQLAVQKIDGSGKELVVEVYRNGVLIKRGATTVPRGVVELQVDLRPPKTTAIPTTLPTTVAATQAANMTVANTTGSNTTATTTTVPPSST